MIAPPLRGVKCLVYWHGLHNEAEERVHQGTTNVPQHELEHNWMQILFREFQSQRPAHGGLFIFEFENCFKCFISVLYFCYLHQIMSAPRGPAGEIPLFIFIDKCVLCHISRGAFGTINKIFTSFYSGENGPWLSRQPPPLVSQWVCWTWSNTRSKWNKLMEKVLATENIHWRL